MKIIESTPDRLVFKAGIPHFNASRCEFDRTSGRARIERVIFFWRMKPVEIALEEIATGMLQHVSTITGEAMSTAVKPQLRLRSGRVINIPMTVVSGKSAGRMMEIINAFLNRSG